MAWTTSISDLRTLLNDGPKDKYRYRKKCFGEVNGTNTKFKTFEFRRVTNLTSATAPLGAYVDGVAATVSTDYPETGEFVLSSAPADGKVVEASYYAQWFLDSELETLIRVAVEWLGYPGDPSVIPTGLQPAVIRYAAGECYMKLAIRWREHLSEMYRVEDAPDPKENSTGESYMKMSSQLKDDARKLRDDFYTRQGQNLQPLFAQANGRVSDTTPRA